jgi:hypothetical protein
VTHQDINYQDREVNYVSGPVTPTWATDRQSFDVLSICPACAGPMTRTVVRGLPTGSKSYLRLREAVEPPIPERVTLVCACGYPHASRPLDSTETGCGAVWKVPLA